MGSLARGVVGYWKEIIIVMGSEATTIVRLVSGHRAHDITFFFLGLFSFASFSEMPWMIFRRRDMDWSPNIAICMPASLCHDAHLRHHYPCFSTTLTQ